MRAGILANNIFSVADYQLNFRLAIWAVKVLGDTRPQRRLAMLEQQHALEKERTRIARDIHDELGVLLTEISLLAITARKTQSTWRVEVHLRKIQDTAREAVRTADGIVWAVHPKMIRLIIWQIILSTLRGLLSPTPIVVV